jgi:hypothetical protein
LKIQAVSPAAFIGCQAQPTFVVAANVADTLSLGWSFVTPGIVRTALGVGRALLAAWPAGEAEARLGAELITYPGTALAVAAATAVQAGAAGALPIRAIAEAAVLDTVAYPPAIIVASVAHADAGR